MMLKKEFLGIEKAIRAIETASSRTMKKEYLKLYKELEKEISKAFAKYSIGGKFSYGEMQKYGRLDALNKKVAKLIKKGHVSVSRQIRDTLKEMAENSFDSTMKVISEAAEQALRGKLLDTDVQGFLDDRITGVKLNDRLLYRRAEVIYRMSEEITRGIYGGEPYRRIAKRMQSVLDNDYVKSLRIVRTEGHRMMEQSSLKALDHANNQGIKMMKIWSTVGDDRVRDSHKHMEGQTVSYGDDFYNPQTGGRGPAPGLMGTADDDINCRCIFVVEIL